MSNWGRYSSHTAGAKQSMVVCGLVSCHSENPSIQLERWGKNWISIVVKKEKKLPWFFSESLGWVFDYQILMLWILLSSFGCAHQFEIIRPDNFHNLLHCMTGGCMQNV